MADLIPTAKNFVRDLASDAVHFPKTTASWPAFKQSLTAAYKEFKSDMFFFRKDSLNPVVTDTVAKLDALLKQENTVAKVDSILETKETAQAALSSMSKKQDEKMGWSFVGLPVALLGGLALGAGVGIPVLLGTFALVMKYSSNRDRAGHSNGTIVEKVNAEIQKIEPAVVFAAPKAQKVLVEKGLLQKAFKAKSFLGGEPEANYTALLAKLPKAVSAAPAAPVANA